MSASGARATSTGADRQQGPEPDMSKSKKAPHLAAVEAADASPSSRPARGTEHTIPELERYATLLRIDCVRMLAVAKSGHLDSSLSAADIVAALYYRLLRHDPERALATWFAAPGEGSPARLPGPVRILRWAFVTNPRRDLFRRAAAAVFLGGRR